MTMLAIRKSAYDNLTPRRRRVIHWIVARLQLDDPAPFTDGTNVWHVWDDARFDLMHIAVIGCLAANVADLPDNYDVTGKTRQEIEQDVRQAIAAHLVRPEDITFDINADPFMQILAANNAPAAIRAGQIPDTWTAVVTTP